MYRQQTGFTAANVPLFTQLFGRCTPTETLRPRSLVPVSSSEDCGTCFPLESHESPVDRCEGTHRLRSTVHITANVTTQTTQPSTPLVEPSHGEPIQGFNSCQLQGDEASGRCESIADNASASHDTLTWGEPTVPFRQLVQELEKRFHEQMGVHRELNSTMRRLDLLRSEVSLYQAEQRTSRLAEALRQHNVLSTENTARMSAALQVSIEPPPSVSLTQPSQTMAAAPQEQPKAATGRPNPFLESVLESYQKERDNRTREKGSVPACVPVKRVLRVDIIRQPEEPLPYRRVYHVPIVEEGQKSEGNIVEKEMSDGALSEVKGSRYGQSHSTSSFITTQLSAPSRSETPRSSVGVLTDISVANSDVRASAESQSVDTEQPVDVESSSTHSPSSVSSSSSSAVSVSDRSVSPSRSSITDEVNDSTSSNRSTVVSVKPNEKNAEPLVATLQELHRACGSANRLMQALLGKGTQPSMSVLKDGETADEHEKSSTASGASGDGGGKKGEKPEWLANLRRDVRDIRKLQRFVDHVKRNIKLIDCNQRAKEVRRKLFLKAQRLAKAQRQIRNNKDALPDVLEDIADIIKSDASSNGEDEVVDDISMNLSAEGGDSIADEIDDDLDFGGSAGAGEDDFADMDDEVMDELQQDRPGDADYDNFADVVSELSWAQEESDFAEALAEASDIDDLLDDEVPLPDEDSLIDEVVDEDAPLVSSVEMEESVEDGADVADTSVDVVDEVADDVENVASSVLITEESGADDADVSTVMPASSASAGSSGGVDEDNVMCANELRRSMAYDDTESAESALNALEQEVTISAGKGLSTATARSPVALLGLDKPSVISVDTLVTEELTDERNLPSSLTAWPAKLNDNVASRALAVDSGDADAAAVPSARQSTTSSPTDGSVAGLPAKAPGTAAYAADDIVAQLHWKERQLLLFEKIRPKRAWAEAASEATPADSDELVEGRAEYHWGVLETLLQHRFAFSTGEDDPIVTESCGCCDDVFLDDYDTYDNSSSGTSEDSTVSKSLGGSTLADAEYSVG